MKVFKIAALVLGLLLLASLLFVMVFGQDISGVDDSDLLLEPSPVLSVEDNMYFDLLAVSDLEAVSTKDATDAFIAASEKPGYQCPQTVNEYDFAQEACELNHLRDLAMLTAERASTSLAQGDIADALNSTQALIKVAHAISAADSPLIEELIAIAIYRMPLEYMDTLLLKLRPTQLAKLQAVIAEYGPKRDHLLRTFRYEYMLFKGAIHTVATQVHEQVAAESAIYRKEKISDYTWHPNRTTQAAADHYRLVIADNGGQSDVSREQIDRQLEKLEMHYSDYSPWRAILPNSIGEILLAVYIGSQFNIAESFNEVASAYSELSQ